MRKPVETVIIQPRKGGKVTLLARRFFNVLLRHAQQGTLHPGAYHQIALSKFTSDARYESRNMEHLTDVLNQMMGTVVNWGDSAKNLTGPRYMWAGAPLVSFARIVKEEGRPAFLEYDFHREIREQLLNPRVYASISLEMLSRMNTHAATALYELAVRYLTNKNGLSSKKPWREWVPILTGNSEISADLQYKYFARDVLKPALRQVNEAQDEFEVIALVTKVHRKVESLQFHIRRKAPASDRGDAPSRLAEVGVEDMDLVGQLRILKVPQNTAEALIVQHGARRMRAALAEMEPRLSQIKNTVAYLKKLLTEGDLNEQEPPNATPANDVHDVATAPVAPQQVTWAAIKRGYCEEAKARAMQLFEEAPAADQLKLVQQFEEERLPALSAALQKSWRSFRPTWPEKPISRFLAPLLKDWLAKDDLNPSHQQMLEWLAEKGTIRLDAE